MVTLLSCRQARTPAPLFSICASEDFWDILFPNVLTSWQFIVHANRAHTLCCRGLQTCSGEHVGCPTNFIDYLLTCVTSIDFRHEVGNVLNPMGRKILHRILEGH